MSEACPVIRCRLGCGKIATKVEHTRFQESGAWYLEDRERAAARWWACRPCMRTFLKRRAGEPRPLRDVDLLEFEAAADVAAALAGISRGVWVCRVEYPEDEPKLQVVARLWSLNYAKETKLAALLRPRFGDVSVRSE